MSRIDGRNNDQLRPVKIITGISNYAEGSAKIEFGNTHVLCTASIEESIPKWLQGSEKGWVTAEYSMLPRSTHTRIRRDKATNSGRSQEISRLIARSLRSCIDLKKLGERQITVDCDVLNADGGTRTAAISGGFVALHQALSHLVKKGDLTELPITHFVSAVSVGVLEGQALLDLCYEEDSRVETDMNFVLVDSGDFVEVQGTAEGKPFSQKQMSEMTEFAQKGCQEIFSLQKDIVKGF